MKLTLEPTDKTQSVDGVPHRVWKGETEKGVPVLAYIRAVSPQTHDEAVNAEFARELQLLPPARATGITYDLRFFVD
jgi:hypothetical protein